MKIYAHRTQRADQQAADIVGRLLGDAGRLGRAKAVCARIHRSPQTIGCARHYRAHRHTQPFHDRGNAGTRFGYALLVLCLQWALRRRVSAGDWCS